VGSEDDDARVQVTGLDGTGAYRPGTCAQPTKQPGFIHCTGSPACLYNS
jgi:hypothetical protein